MYSHMTSHMIPLFFLYNAKWTTKYPVVKVHLARSKRAKTQGLFFSPQNALTAVKTQEFSPVKSGTSRKATDKGLRTPNEARSLSSSTPRLHGVFFQTRIHVVLQARDRLHDYYHSLYAVGCTESHCDRHRRHWLDRRACSCTRSLRRYARG